MRKMKIKFAFIWIPFMLLMISCKKDPIINTPDRIGISRVTYYPTITLTGDAIVTVPNGVVYTEPGVKATAGTAEVPVTSTGFVDTGKDGVYTISYSAKNADGYSSFASRIVIVYTTAPDAAAHDLSGTYLRTATGSSAVWTNIAPGVYQVFNPGGSPGTNLTVIVFNPSAFKILIPPQLGSDGTPTSSTNESYTNSTPATYSWRIVNPGYGSALRTFIKQ
jgi:Domain of unknown function (DUF5011)